MANAQRIFESEDQCGVDCMPIGVGKNYTVWVKRKNEDNLSDNLDKKLYESTIRALEAEIANAGVYMVIDSSVRKTYSQQIQKFSDELRMNASQGKITWSQAATEAQQVRNTVMMMLRGKSTPLGLAIAENMKKEGKTLNELIARKSIQLHGEKANFNTLSNEKKIRFMQRLLNLLASQTQK